MKVALGLLVVVALLGATGGARIRRQFPELDIQQNDDAMDRPPSYDNDDMDRPPSYDNDDMNRPPSYDNDTMDRPPRYDLSIEDELVDVDSFNMSIFPREEDMDKSLFISEKDADLTGSCAMAFYMPNKPSHSGPCGASYFYVKLGCHHLYPAVCHTCHGEVPGFYHGGYCYYEFGHGLHRVCSWDWIGLVHGRAHLYHGKYHTCGIFGGYQNNHGKPLYTCAARHNGWIIPGKLHREYNRCYYLNRSTTCYYSLIAC